MNGAGKLIGKNAIHHPVAVDAAFAGKDIGADGDLEMRFAAFAPAGMASMFVADIKNLDLAW